MKRRNVASATAPRPARRDHAAIVAAPPRARQAAVDRERDEERDDPVRVPAPEEHEEREGEARARDP